jgi:hypothetical protein
VGAGATDNGVGPGAKHRARTRPTEGRDSVENAVTRRYLDRVSATARVASRCRESDLLRTAYGERFLTRPVFLDPGDRDGLERDLIRMYELLLTVPARLFGGDLGAFARAVGMRGPQVEATLRSVSATPTRLARADLYQESTGFRLLELNMTSALGGFDNAEINRAAVADPELAAFVEEERLAYADTLRTIVDTMRVDIADLDAPSRPVVALADWPSSFPTLGPRLKFMEGLLDRLGVRAIACHVGELEPRDGALYVHGVKVDVVYRFFLIEDLLDGSEAPELVGRILDAVDRGTVRLFTTLDAELYGNKGALGLVSDDANRGAFTADEREFLDRFLPWTRALRDGPAFVDGVEVDLVSYVVGHRDELVLKPTLFHGGIGVVTGWTTTADEWTAAVKSAVGAPFVVQRRVRPRQELFPSEDEPGRGEILALNWGVFLTSAGYGGAIVRGTANPDVGVVSMVNGARVGCCFHPADRTEESDRHPVPAQAAR